ncbi:MAG: peptide chain release factor N(5)-glutamine methyltransferase [Hydrococcus sp. C42_A2020_068]|nr:peptide chain release factor N(5)-glutamine methyltransferase [Hydrococcus sp. C42_A2020_068]
MESLTVSGQELALWRDRAKQDAIAAGVSPDEVDWLLEEVVGLDKLSLRLESFKERAQIHLKQPLSVLTELWQQRLQDRMPVQYLVGVAPWRHFSLKVATGVLIPRPETELLVDLAVRAIQASPTPDLVSGYWVDLGTGSGAIALGLAEALPDARIYATDTSAEALAIARQNAIALGFGEQIKFCQGSWWSPLEALKGRVSGMVSNPPYIPTAEIARLQPEVARHEPRLALDGGSDGLDCIRHLVETAPDYLRPGGIWLIEMMAGQAEQVVQLLQKRGCYDKIQIFCDLANIERFALAYRC